MPQSAEPGVSKGSAERPVRLLGTDNFTQRVLADFELRLDYDKQAKNWHEPLALELVKAAGLAEGQEVLDVATGTGLVAEAAAQAVGPTGSVLGIDISSQMLAQGAHRARQQPNIRFQQADAQAADFEPGTFDAVLCSNGLLYMADVSATLQLWASWLRPGGRLCFNTPLASNWEYTHNFIRAARTEDVWLEEPAEVIGSVNKVQRILQDAGFSEHQIQIEASQAQQGLKRPVSLDKYIQSFWDINMRFFPLDTVLSPDAVERVRAEWVRIVQSTPQAALNEQGGIDIVLDMMCVVATKR